MAPAADRRQLTVMFCDLVGSTALTQTLDPEALRELMAAYQKTCGSVVEKYEGYVAQYLGDGLMIYFGWPRAHEDDAERTIHAALEIVETVKQVSAPSVLQVCIGIATGQVVVGKNEIGDESTPRLAVGETPNIASRLQALASADQVVVAASTHRLAGGVFEYADFGEHVLRGIIEPIRTWRILGLGKAEGRFEAAHGGRLTPFIGRQEEISLLAKRWESAREGEAQVVLLCGEPGIGKSRIVQALREAISPGSHTRLRYQCSPFHTQSAFHPVIAQLERAADFRPEDSTDTKLEKLEASLRKAGPETDESLQLIASLLNLDSSSRFPPISFSSQRQKEETINALCAQVTGLAARQPVLLVFEDAHWADPSTLEALDVLFQRIRGSRVLALVTFRPEFPPRWTDQSHVMLLTLNRLARKQVAHMIAEVTRNKPLPAQVLEQIVAKTDGVPLFVEELTQAVLESGILTEDDNQYRLEGRLSDLSIPSTLQDSLMARLDRLAPVKEVAQIGACIGRTFPFALVAAVSPLDDAQVAQFLEQLTASGLVHRSGGRADATYTFKHALVQDVAYQSILKSARARLHEKIAQVLLNRHPGLVETDPEMIAHHYTQAGLAEEALPFWSSAGQKALARTALPESVGHLSKALELVQTMPQSVSRDRSELDIRINLAISLMAYGGWTQKAIPAVLAPAGDLANRLGDSRNELISLYYIGQYQLCILDIEQARQNARKLDTLAEVSGEESVKLIAASVWAATECMAGEWLSAMAHGDRALALYDFDRHSSLTFLLNHDVQTMVLAWAAHYYWALGMPEKARQASLTCLKTAPRIDHTFNKLVSLTGASAGLIHTGETKKAIECNFQARTLVRENAMHFGENGPCNYFGGSALIVEGRYAEGYEMATRGVAFWNSTGGELQDPWVNSLRAQALGHLGKVVEGITVANEILRFTQRTGHRTWEPFTYSVLGDLLVQSHRDGDARLLEAEAAYNEALQISRAKSARGFELIASTGLARLWKSQGKVQEALELLKPVYDWFTEGFDTKDLREAKLLLDDLESRT